MAANTAMAFAAWLGGFYIRPLADDYLPLVLQQYLDLRHTPATVPLIPFRVEYRPTRCHPTVLPSNPVVQDENVLTTFSGVISTPSWIAALLTLFILLLTAVAFGRWIGKTADLIAQVKELVKKAAYHQSSSLTLIGSLQAQINELRSQVTFQKDSASAANDQATELQTQLDDNEDELSDARGQISELEIAEQELKTENEGLKRSLDSEEKLRSQADENAKSVGGQLATAQEEIEELKGQLATAQKDVQKHKKASKDLDSVNQRLDTANSRVEALEREKAQLTKDKNGLKQSVSDQKQATDDSEKEVNELRGRLNTASKRASSLDGDIKKLKSTVDQLTTDRDAEKGLRELAENQLQGKEGEVSRLRSNKQKLEASVADKQKELENKEDLLEAAYSDMRNDIAKTDSETSTLRRQNESLQSQLRKECMCKRLGGSNGSNDDGGDENDDSGSGDGPDASNDDEADDGGSSQPSNSSTLDDGAAPKGSGSSKEEPQDQENSDDGLSSSSPVNNDTDVTKRQQVGDLDDGLSSSGPSPANGADTAFTPGSGNASNPSIVGLSPTPTPCPLGRPHIGCTTMFILPPGYDNMARGKKRSEQAKFKKAREALQCAFVAYTSMHPGVPVPVRYSSYILEPGS